MRVLITGATGFLGSRLVARLTDAGHTCQALSRSAERARRAVPALDAAWDWEPLQGPPPAEALAGVDAVINLAGESVVGRWTAAKKRAIHDSRAQGTRHLVAALEAADPRPQILVSASAIGYYGDRGEELLPETASPGDDFLAGVCRDWEQAAEEASALGLRTVRVRIGLVLHPAGGALQAMLTPFRLGAGGPLGSGRQWWPWIHLDDLLGLLERALTDPELRGPLNAVAPEPVRQRDFARCLARVLGRPAFLPAPRLALRVALGEFSVELLSSRRVDPAAARALGFSWEHPELEQALRHLLA